MKKFFSIIALSAMTLSLSSFSDQDQSDLITRNCSMEAIATYDFLIALGHSQAAAFESADESYNNCISDGGNPGGAIISNEEEQ